jgi:hypothetical protein
MNEEYRTRLEGEIDRALKELPELSAPRTLSARVLAAIETRLALPWYRQSWQAWPVALRAVSLTVLLALFAGLCLGTWEILHGASFATAMHEVGRFFAPVAALWSAVNALMAAVVVVIKNLGTGILIGCVSALALGYAMCLGLGTVYLRLAFARR